MRHDYVAAEPCQLYWRREKCPHQGAKVLLLTIGGICTVGQWQGEYGFAFVAWCPLPKDATPKPSIYQAPLIDRIRLSVKILLGAKAL